jgi:ATP-dependent helicase/nuclease subunit B
MQRGGFHKVSLEDTMGIAMAYSQAYAKERFSQLDSQRIAYLFQRNVLELSAIVEELWQELSVSEFVPADFELSFGDGQKMDAIAIDNDQMEAQLRGFVDRVDVWNNGHTNYFRVVDYKTGRKDFDYCDVFNGIGLQMLLYLFALEQGGEELLGENLIPAGVQYFAARSPFVTANGRL